MRVDPSLSKREMARRSQEMANRYQAMLNRQVDSINRLLGSLQDDDSHGYEHEMLALNNHLAAMDLKVEELTLKLNRLRQSIVDQLAAHGEDVCMGSERLEKMLTIIDEKGTYDGVEMAVPQAEGESTPSTDDNGV